MYPRFRISLLLAAILGAQLQTTPSTGRETSTMACINTQELLDTVNKMSAPGKGLLAADESTATAGKRVRARAEQPIDAHRCRYASSSHMRLVWMQLASINQPNTEDNRRALREFLFTAPGVEDYISGVVRTIP